MMSDEHDDQIMPEKRQREHTIVGETYSSQLSYRHQDTNDFIYARAFIDFAHISGALREVYYDRVKRS